MLKIKSFTFNAFQENMYILIDEVSKECIIIDPGCNNTQEENELINYIESNGLQPKRLINTHCHIDHVLGNQLISDKYSLTLEAHELEKPVLGMCQQVGSMYGIPYKGSPEISTFHHDGDVFSFAGIVIQILFTPGHSPGSICLYLKEQNELIGGDVLFQGSIGRTDLPGGDHATLIGSIMTKLMPLPDETIVYSGHGPSTTIGRERVSNPFLN